MATSQIITLPVDGVVRCTVSVSCGAAETFETFRHDFFHWWPHDFTWSGELLQNLFFEGRKGGILWEQGPEGFRIDWARVLRWIPPEKIVLRWHIGPDGQPQPSIADASTVEIRFVEEAASRTRLELEHTGISRHGSGVRDDRAFMGSESVWPSALNRFAEYCAQRDTRPARRVLSAV
jgi:uncharacterized protein YndB with AHSA1/START domain